MAMAADHLSEGIRVNCVHPGTADTPWVGRLLAPASDPAAERVALERRQPHGRLVTAEEVAAAIAYLASPDAGSTTGAALAVDGGMSGLRLPPRAAGAGVPAAAQPPPGDEPLTGTPPPARNAAGTVAAGTGDAASTSGAAAASSGDAGSSSGDAGTPWARVALHTRLKPGMVEAYETVHAEIPADLHDAIVQAGAHRWTIWRSGNELFHVIECDDYGWMLAELGRSPVNQAWQVRMAEYLDAVHDYSAAGPSKGLPVVWEL